MSFSESEGEKLIEIVAKYPVLYNTGHTDYRNNLLRENVWKSIGKELSKTSDDCKKKWKFIRDGYNRFKKKHALGTDDDNVILEPTEIRVKRQKRNKEEEVLKMWRERDKNRQILLQSLQKQDDDLDLFRRHTAEVLRNLPPVTKAEAKRHLSVVLCDYEIKAENNTFSTQNPTTLLNCTASSDSLASTSSQYSLPTPESAYNLLGSSNAPQFANFTTTEPEHYNMPNAYFPTSARSTSPVLKLLFQRNQEKEGNQKTNEYCNL